MCVRRKCVLLSVLALTACAGEDAARSIADISADVIHDRHLGVTKQVNAFNKLNQENEALLSRSQAETASIETAAAARAGAWRVAGDKSAVDVFEGAPRKTSEQIVIETKALAGSGAPDSKPLAAPDEKSVNALVKALNEVAEEPSFGDRVKALITFAGNVQSAFEKNADDTANKTDDVAAKTADTPGATEPDE